MRRRKAVDRGFALSDAAVLAQYLQEQGLDADIATRYGDEGEGDPAGGADP